MADSSPLAHSPTLTARALEEDTRQLDAGTKVGDYVVDRMIGAGAMGEVYAGKHPVIGKRVAIKVLRHELAASPQAAERFIREARAVNQIDHENVIDVFAFGRLDDGQLYLVMDLVEGKSLRAQLVNGPLPIDRALTILDTIADKFTAAQQGIVFASDDEVIDQRAPNDPRCHVPVRVEYHYDPAGDVLEQKREKVAIDFVHGSCVVRSRDAETTHLVRVDAAHETVEISAPAGNFGKAKSTKRPPKSAPNVTKKPTATYNDPGDMAGKVAVPQQAMPQKQQEAAPPVKK